MKEFLNKKILTPILNLLKQGVTPKKISQSISAGVVICCFPVLGTTTPICILAAALFKLNHVAIQIANYAAYPLQIALIIPFLKLGNSLFGAEDLNLEFSYMMEYFNRDMVGFVKTYGVVTLKACLAWLVVAPLAYLLIYSLLFPVIKRAYSQITSNS